MIDLGKVSIETKGVPFNQFIEPALEPERLPGS
jgi:hypothetical protein